jgi:phage terminase large subunit
MPQGLNLDVSPVFLRNWQAINQMVNGDAAFMAQWYQKYESYRRYKYIINTGSSRSSKTFSLIDCFDLYARGNKGKRLTAWRDTKADCKKTVMADTIKHFKATGRFRPELYAKTESIFHYPTGSTFEIHGTDDENTVHGLTQDAAWLNEPYLISRPIFDQIDQRTSDFIFIDWNPRKKHWIDDIAKDPRAIIIHSTFKDNPFCPPEQRNKILSYQPIKMCEAVLLKLFHPAEKGTEINEDMAREYDCVKNEKNIPGPMLLELVRCQENEAKKSANEYNWSVYGLGLKAERPNRIFKWKEISLSDYLALDVPEYTYCDWGAVDPWAIGDAKYYDGGLYLRERNYASENTVRMTLNGTDREQISGLDAALKDADAPAEKNGIVTWMFTKLGIPRNRVIICDSARPTKIRALRKAGYEYAIGVAKPANSVIDGIDLLNNITVYYTSDSENIQSEQENYSRKIDRYGIIMEEPEDFDNHHMDGARYTGLFLHQQGVIRVA